MLTFFEKYPYTNNLRSLVPDELIEAEISRAELEQLNVGVNDLVRVHPRQAHSFEADYTI